jgi:hypothetical protein
MLPNLVIIGAAKCGTTSLHRYLARHPEIHMSEPKELDFFVAELNGSRGVRWYERHFNGTRSCYHAQLSHYLRFTSRERILVCDRNDLLHDRERTWRRVFGFLGVALTMTIPPTVCGITRPAGPSPP